MFRGVYLKILTAIDLKFIFNLSLPLHTTGKLILFQQEFQYVIVKKKNYEENLFK